MDKSEKFKEIIEINNLQRQLNKDFEEQGLTDEILDRQIELNKKRHELDVVDELEPKLYENFVQ